MTIAYFDKSGGHFELGHLIGKGGEGSVYEICGRKDHVAKIYHRAPSPEKARKLATMASMRVNAFIQFAAWPISTLHQHNGGPLQGIVLPRISNAKEIHELYSPSHRKQSFPTFDYRHLVHTARNCAIAFSTLHSQGIVVGDVNQGNLFVDNHSMVKFIDCDSFQISLGSETFRCMVGVAHFTPPELQSKKLSDVNRTQNHDNFGLAVVLFHLLFMGRHPFVGRYSGKGDMPIEKAIKEHRFAFGNNAPRYAMAPPPFSLSKEQLPDSVFSLFERAFSHSSIGSIARPKAEEWGNALGKFEASLRQCSTEDAHYYWNHSSHCPWCRIHSEGGPDFFVAGRVKFSPRSSLAFDWSEILRRIELVPRPGQTFKPNHATTPPPIHRHFSPARAADDAIRKIFGVLGLAAFGLSIVGLLITSIAALLFVPAALCLTVWFVMSLFNPIHKERISRRRALRLATTELEKAERELTLLANSHIQLFDAKRSQVFSLKSQLDGISARRAGELASLNSSARERQLELHLKKCFVDKAGISGIGPSRIASLESFGIDTAWDVTASAVARVPGFGPELTSRLLAWRMTMESRFQFDPTKGVPQSLVDAIEVRFDRLRIQIESEIRQCPEELTKINSSYVPGIAACWQKVKHLKHVRDQAAFDFAQIPTFTL